jgi:hypothetical protein
MKAAIPGVVLLVYALVVGILDHALNHRAVGVVAALLPLVLVPLLRKVVVGWASLRRSQSNRT